MIFKLDWLLLVLCVATICNNTTNITNTTNTTNEIPTANSQLYWLRPSVMVRVPVCSKTEGREHEGTNVPVSKFGIRLRHCHGVHNRLTGRTSLPLNQTGSLKFQ